MTTVTEKSASSAATSSDSSRAAYRQPLDDVLAALGVDTQRGLSAAAARARLERYGTNELAAEKPCRRGEKIPRAVSRCAGDPAAHRTLVSAGRWLYEREKTSSAGGEFYRRRANINNAQKLHLEIKPLSQGSSIRQRGLGSF
jgi:hypothetical protein